MACCSMRRRSPRYQVFDRQGNVILSVKEEHVARNLAVQRGGYYREEWHDDPT